MSMEEGGPGRAGEALERAEQEEFMQEAEHERLVKETREIHAEEAAEHGEAPAPKTPWWKFWKS